MSYSVTPDNRYFVVCGRLWRRSSPMLDEAERARRVQELMRARRDVRVAGRRRDGRLLRQARRRVHEAKVALGERGPVWWDDGAPGYNRFLVANTPYRDWYLGRPLSDDLRKETMVPRPVHFEIHASDPESVQHFYKTLFGWEFQSWEGPMEYWLITTGAAEAPGINGGLLRRRGPAPVEGQAVNAFVCTVDVPDLERVLTALPGARGTVAVPRMAVPGVGWLAYLKDPDGNICGVMQADSAAR